MKQENILMTRGRSKRLCSYLAVIVVLFLLLPSLCYSSGLFGERDDSAGTAGTFTHIYVMDFELDAVNMESAPGILQRPHEQGRLGNLLPRPLAQGSPSDQARELVNLMSASLVKELIKLGFDARRADISDATLSGGLLVRGVFAHVDEGNRLRRAVIGFGAGETELQVVVSVDDLSQGLPKPLYELTSGAESSKMPGAIITLNPYAAAAKFVLSKKDLDKSVKKTAKKIAAEVAKRAGR